MPELTKCDFKAVSVLIHEFSAYDMADCLADYTGDHATEIGLWSMSAHDLAMAAVDLHPGGAVGLQLELQGF